MVSEKQGDGLTLEKLKIDERLQGIELYVKEGKQLRSDINDTLTLFNAKLFGDPKAKDKVDRDGLIRRIEDLEADKLDHKNLKEGFLKVAVGSLTMAIGSFVYWLWKCLMDGIHQIKG